MLMSVFVKSDAVFFLLLFVFFVPFILTLSRLLSLSLFLFFISLATMAHPFRDLSLGRSKRDSTWLSIMPPKPTNLTVAADLPSSLGQPLGSPTRSSSPCATPLLESFSVLLPTNPLPICRVKTCLSHPRSKDPSPPPSPARSRWPSA